MIIRLYEVVDKPPGVFYSDEPASEWGEDCGSVMPTFACCSKGFVEYVSNKIKKNHSGFPTMMHFGSAETWIILEVTKLN